jgi:hypothetical protein
VDWLFTIGGSILFPIVVLTIAAFVAPFFGWVRR